MTKLEGLYDEIDNDGILINNMHFSDNKKAGCVMSGELKTMVIDHAAMVDGAEELAIVAEEYAHYETGALYMVNATYNTPIERTNRIVAEGKARRHATKKLIPFDEMSEVFSKFVYAEGLDIYELAEYFNVPTEYMKQAIEYYHQQGERW